MERFTQSDLQAHIEDVAAAAELGPVAIAMDRGEDLIVVSGREYAWIRTQQRQAIKMVDLPPELVAELRKPIDDPELFALNSLLDTD